MDNYYHDRDDLAGTRKYIEETHPGLTVKLDEVVQAARAGTLTEELFHSIGAEGLFSYTGRALFTQPASWAVFTVEYHRSLAKYLRKLGVKKVLEVCCGHGLLVEPMRKLGFDWVGTEEKVPKNAPHKLIIELGALEAAEKYADADLLFASWIPYTSNLDQELFQLWVSGYNKPMLIVGESGGCTGSEGFEGVVEDAGCSYVYQPLAHDVPQWSGIHDHTSLIAPRGFPRIKM